MAAQPIDTAPKDGRLVFVGDDAGTVAKAFWHSFGAPNAHGLTGFWAYWMHGSDWVEQIDFTPTRWGESPSDL